MSISPWDLLGLDEGSSTSQLRRAFRSLALVHHPDKGCDPSAFQSIKEAFDSLYSHQQLLEIAPSPRQLRPSLSSANSKVKLTSLRPSSDLTSTARSRSRSLRSRTLETYSRLESTPPAPSPWHQRSKEELCIMIESFQAPQHAHRPSALRNWRFWKRYCRHHEGDYRPANNDSLFLRLFWHKLEQKESASVRPSEQPPPPQEVSVQPLRLQQRLAVTQILKWWQPEWGAKCSTPLCARVSTNEQGTCNSCYDVTHSTFDP